MEASTFERWAWWRKGAPAAILALIAVLAAVDVAVDLGAGTTGRHVAVEASMFAVALAAALWLIAKLISAARNASTLRDSLARSRADAEQWRREASKWTRGLSEAIDRQLEGWALTAAEKEIALLLLKGLSHKEIAQVRAVEESSVRQQARAVYRKAGLQGRSELAAFFLEDVLAPPPGPAGPRG